MRGSNMVGVVLSTVAAAIGLAAAQGAIEVQVPPAPARELAVLDKTSRAEDDQETTRAGIPAQPKAALTSKQALEERRKAIAECEAMEGIPVVVAGELASRGIACAEPVGRN